MVLDLRVSRPDGDFTFDSLGLSDADAAKAQASRACWASTTRSIVPVNKVVEVETTGADVIHSLGDARRWA